jgi:hypothetical protein
VCSLSIIFLALDASRLCARVPSLAFCGELFRLSPHPNAVLLTILRYGSCPGRGEQSRNFILATGSTKGKVTAVAKAIELKILIGSENTVRAVCVALAGAPELLLFLSACKAQVLDC